MPAHSRPPAQLYALTPEGLASIPPPEGGAPGELHALMKGVPPGVYSALRTWKHDRFLWLDEHIARTQRSMRGLEWDYVLDEGGLRRALHQLAQAWPEADSRIRFDILEEISPWLGTESRVLLGIARFDPVPERFVREGVCVAVAPGLERHQPLLKTTEFILRREPYPLSTQERYEHLLVEGDGPDALVLEGSSSNVFGVQKGGLRTSGPGVLEGITRKVVLHVARRMELSIDETPIPLSSVGALDEAFLTSSVRGIVPIVGIAGTTIGDGRPGALTRRLTAAYLEFAASQAARAVQD